MWRYQEGIDKEQAYKASRKLTPEEEAQLQVPIVAKTGEQRFIEQIIGRQKLKKSYTYEIKWKGLGHKVRLPTRPSRLFLARRLR